MTDAWSPAQYERFKRERAQAFYDLLALLRPATSARVLDLGCGTGELTRELHEKLGARATLGIDSSAAMLEKAQAEPHAGLEFQKANILAFLPESSYDVVFSNAALHW